MRAVKGEEKNGRNPFVSAGVARISHDALLFRVGDRKGGVLTPPQSGSQPSVRLAPRAVRRLTDCAGRETGEKLEEPVTAGLKPRPSPFVVRNRRYVRLPVAAHASWEVVQW